MQAVPNDDKDPRLAAAFDIYYPVIKAARDLRNYYMGADPKVCPDHLADLIIAYNKAEKQMRIVSADEVKHANTEPEKGE